MCVYEGLLKAYEIIDQMDKKSTNRESKDGEYGDGRDDSDTDTTIGYNDVMDIAASMGGE
jgi:hypothetical protein